MPPRKNRLPPLFPDGWVVTDTFKKTWKLGKKLGQGGFGLIYLASPACDARVRNDAAYIIKVEDHQNGPLFCELKFYQRAAKPNDVSKWIQRHNLDYLGIPRYWGSGETTFNSISYRFMVLDRLGSDLYNVQKSNNNKLPLQAVLQVAVRMLDVLEYIHEHEYVHGDIKAGNILCHLSDPSKVYLADYGLSYRYCPDGNHKEYKEDPRKCHNGTLEFTSLDAHRGAAASRRGDLEILSFCMLHWLSGRLPWDQDLKVPANVQAAKQKLMDELPNSVTAWLGQGDGCTDIAKFMVEVRTLQYNVTPNYKGLKGILFKALESSGTRLGAPLIFSSQRSTLRRPPAAKTKTQIEELKAHQNKVNDDEDNTKHPKSFHSPKPHWLQKTSKQVKRTNGVDTVNTDDEDSVGGATYGKSTNVEISRFDLKVGYVGTHKPMETENCNTSQNNNFAFNRNLGVHKAKTYWEEWKAPIKRPKSPHQNCKGKTYWEEPLRDPHSPHRHRKGSTYWEEETLKEPDSLHQDSQDIYKYGLIITVLLFMIYWLIYKV